MFPHSTNQSNQILQGLSPCLILAISKRPCPGISSAVIQQNIRLEILFTATNTFTKRHVFTSVTFYVCFEYIVSFSRSRLLCTFCSSFRSVFIGWLDCQSSFWRHDVLPIFWCASCIWGLQLIVCVCAMPAYLVLQHGQRFAFKRQLSPDA